MRIRSLLFVASFAAVAFASSAAFSAPPRDLRPIVLRWEGGGGLREVDVRRAIARELEAPIVLPDEGAASAARGSLTVRATEDHVEIIFRDEAGKETRRTIVMEGDARARATTIALIAGNIARDEAGDVLWKLETEAPPPTPSAESPSAESAPTKQPMPPMPALDRAKPTPAPEGDRTKLILEVDGAALFALSSDGDLAHTCTGSCSKGLTSGGAFTARGALQTSTGYALGLDSGYASLSETISGRPTEMTPMGLHAATGVATDAIGIHGVTFGASVSKRVGETWPVQFRVGFGFLVGSGTDSRSGTFTYTNDGTPRDPATQTYSIDNVAVTPTQRATYLYVAPEVRVGYRPTKHIEVSLGLEAKFFTALHKPAWLEALPTNQAVQIPTGSSEQSLGSGSFPTQTIFGNTILAIAPSLGARYEF